MGLQLHATFVKAGLPAPSMAVSALAGGGSDSMSGIDLISDLAATMAPVMEQMGVIAASELGPETLQDRIRAEAYASGAWWSADMRWAPGHDECRHHGHAPALPSFSPLELKLTAQQWRRRRRTRAVRPLQR